MTNSLNITTTNLKKNSNMMWLHDPAVYMDFHDSNGLLSMGYMEKEKVFKVLQEYVNFEEGVPAVEIRRDMIRQEFLMEGKLMQLQPETIALLMQRRYDSSDSEWNRVIMGDDVPAPLFVSIVLIGKNVNGKELRLYIRKAQITTEQFELILGGDKYGSIPFAARACKDESPIATNPDWAYVGKESITGDITSGSLTIANVSNCSNLVVGSPIVGTGIPEGATIAAFDDTADTITIATGYEPTATSTTEALTTAKTTDYNDQDNIAFFAWEKAA